MIKDWTVTFSKCTGTPFQMQICIWVQSVHAFIHF
jgi:hypothetical protein